MFNENQKNRYIDYKENAVIVSINYLKQKFNSVEKFEEKNNKDLSCFNYYEIVDMYKTMGNPSFDSIVVMNSVFSLYTEWCIKEGLVVDNQNHFKELSRKEFSDCVNKALAELQFVDRKTVLSWCNELPNASDAFIILGLFEGIKGPNYSELASTLISGIKKDRIELSSGRTLNVSSELIDIATKAGNEEELLPLNAGGQRVSRLESDGLILHNLPQTREFSENGIRRRIYYRLARIFSYLGVPYMTGNKLTMSGIIFCLKEKAAELGISPVEAYENVNVKKEIEDRYLKKFKRGQIYEYLSSME